MRPTRTPLPTFTPTVETQIVIPPTDTPAPAPPTPEPTVEPTPTEVRVEDQAGTEAADETSQEIEVVSEEVPPTEPPPPPTEPPPPPPTEPPPPAAPADPVAGPNGVIGKITFRDGRNTYGVGERVFVKIEATNTQPGQRPFGILGLTTSTGAFQTSWSSGTIDDTFTHEDGISFEAPGNHKLWLSICFSSEAECQGPNGDWERFEPGLDVVIQ